MRHILPISFLVVLVFIAYFNSLDNAFVADDIPALQQNPELGSWSAVWKTPLSFIRPLIYFSIHQTSGLSPTAFHFASLLFHFGTVLVLYLILCLWLDDSLALFSASLFAVHPLMTEAVTWISGAIHGQYSFFLMLALLFYLFPKSRKLYLLSFLSFLLALFSSEKAMVFPIILLVFYLAFEKGSGAWKKLLPYLAIGSAWFFVYLFAIPQRLNALETQYYGTRSLANPLLQIPIAIGNYLQLIFWPRGLTLYHSEMSFSLGQYLGYLVIFLSLLGLILWGFKRNKNVFFWSSFFIISLLPTLTPFGISWIVAERYVYLGSIGVFVLLGLLVKQISQKLEKPKLFSSLLLLLIPVLTLATINRNQDWQNQDSLWLAAAKTSPSSPQNHNNLGDYYGRQGDFEKAVQEFQKAIELNPGYADAFHNLANTYGQMGKMDLAIENYQKAIEFNPGLWQSYQNIAVIYFNQGKFDSAAQYQEKAVAIDPQNASLHYNLAAIYQKLGLKEKTDQELQKAFELDPKLKENLSL